MISVVDDNRRVAQLPVMPQPTEEWAALYSQHVKLASAPPDDEGNPFTLRLVQAWALASYQEHGGFFAPIVVGGGKTLLSLCVPHIGFTARGHKKAMLLIPPSLGDQLIKQDIPWVRARMPMSYQWYSLVGKSKAARSKIIAKDRPGLYIVPYTALSGLDGLEIMRAIRPTLVVADEAHTLARESARSKKYWGVLNEIKEQGDTVEFCAMSGTMAKKKLKDFHRLLVQALGDGAPVPLMRNNIDEWDMSLGADAQKFLNHSVSWLPPWAAKAFPDTDFTQDTVGGRKAFQYRMRSAPGVISSDSASCDARLKIGHYEVPDAPATKGWDELQKMSSDLNTMGMKPNGELVSTPMHIYNIAAELANGFYNDPYWPDAAVVARRRGISEGEATHLIFSSRQYHLADQAYRSVLFPWIKKAPLGFDSDLEVGGKIARGDTNGIADEVVDAWQDRHGCDFEGRLERDHRYVIVCEWKLDATIERVKRLMIEKQRGTLIWAQNHAVADALLRKLTEHGIENYAVGPRFPKVNKDKLYEKRYQHAAFVLSVQSCAHGLNLQYTFHTNIYAQVLRSASLLEQSLGRTHRDGQKEAEVYAEILLTEGTDHDTLGACLVDATFTHQTLGNEHKALLASWEPPPRLPPPEMLRSKVPNVESLDPSMAREYLRRFGCN